jgi:hypothetical protein
MARRMSDANEVVLRRGLADTRATLERWNARPWPVLGEWLAWSAVVAGGLLFAVWVVATSVTPDSTQLHLPGVTEPAGTGDAAYVLLRNFMVLALHSLACFAGFLAGSAIPQGAALRSGLGRKAYELAGPLAIAFVVAATTFSLVTQAYVLGSAAATLSTQLAMTPGELVIGISLHAFPELIALFLPLAAWTVASRRGEWSNLLAATIVTTLVAIPVLVLASVVEVYLSPRLILSMAGI